MASGVGFDVYPDDDVMDEIEPGKVEATSPVRLYAASQDIVFNYFASMFSRSSDELPDRPDDLESLAALFKSLEGIEAEVAVGDGRHFRWVIVPRLDAPVVDVTLVEHFRYQLERIVKVGATPTMPVSEEERELTELMMAHQVIIETEGEPRMRTAESGADAVGAAA